jgi:acyl CoA:acetate/3-ketoacid CoA transferase beta subunit
MTEVPYAAHELMICRIAAEVTDDSEDIVVLGSFTPLAYAAYMLAKMTHAPDVWMVGYNAIGIAPVELSFTGAEGAAYKSRLANGSFHENANLIHLGTRGLLECVSSAQLDGSGAINLSVIGPYDNPKVRLPGGAGSPEVLQNYRRVVAYFSRHDPRTFVQQVDFVTGRRTPIGAGKRAAGGLVGGPVLIVTPLAVLRKDDDDEPFTIESLTPGVGADEVIAATGFELAHTGAVPTTPEPTPAQLSLLRERIDPFGTARFDFLGGAERIAYLEAILDREWARATAWLAGQDRS